MSWFDSAKSVITTVHQEQLSKGVTDKAEILKDIDAAYPFGLRQYFPYKAWLRARKEFIARNGGAKAKVKDGDLFSERAA
jgi:hypothetical protein